MHHGEASSSAGKRPRYEDRSGSDMPRRRGRARRASRGSRAARAEPQPEPEIAEVENVQPIEVSPAGGRRAAWPRGPYPVAHFAAGWTGTNLVLDPSSHISQRCIGGAKDPGYMRTFSGYTSVFWAYNHVFSDESKAILSESAFGHVIAAWQDIDRVNPTANLMLLRAFLDREVIDLIGDVLEPLPVNRTKPTFLIRTICILEYFEGKGKGKVDPRKGNHRQNARLWLWWFLGALFLGDKGKRVTTQILRYLTDLGRLGDYDWVTPALGLTIKYWRDAICPDKVMSTSQPSLVFPGIIMESWVLSHFPTLLPDDFDPPRPTYPAVHGWATCDRSGWGLSYDFVRGRLNDLIIQEFVTRPFAQCRGVPEEWLDRMMVRDPARLYLTTPFDDFWYLGERLSIQTRGGPIVPVDPPSCLFVQTRDAVVRRDQFREGETDSLLLPDADYTTFVWTRLALGPIEAIDPELAHQPPDVPIDIEYEDGEDEGSRRTYTLPPTFPLESDIGMDSWVAKVKKVAGGVHKKLWRTANRWRAAAARLSAALCQSRKETEAMRREAQDIRREYDEYRAAHP